MSTSRCPHCGTTAAAKHARAGGYRCNLCGGPRVLGEADVALSGDEVPLLKEARRATYARWLWLIGAFASGLAAFAGFSVALVAHWLAEPSTIGTGLLFGLPMLPLTFALFASLRSRRATKASGDALHAARRGAVRDAIQGGRELSASDVTKLFALPPPQAEALLAELNVDDSIMSTVTDTGDVTYRTANLKLRIEEAARAAGLPPSAAADEVAIGDSPSSQAADRAPSPPGTRSR